MVVLEGQRSEDFERSAPERRPCDSLEGNVYTPSPATERHQEQVGLFYVLLKGVRNRTDGGRVLLGPAVLRIDAEHKPEPDVFAPPAPGDPRGVPALLVAEFVSDSARAHDLGRKASASRDAAIPEVWLFDDRDRILFADRLDRGSLPTRAMDDATRHLGGGPRVLDRHQPVLGRPAAQ